MSKTKEIEDLVKLLKSPVKNIKYETNMSIIEFENGQTIPLYGGMMELDFKVPTCNFCNNPSGGEDDPLFTMDDKNHICKKCSILALETFLNNGVNVDLKIGEFFPEAVKQINDMVENVNKT